MTWVAVAIGGSALLGAGASIYGADQAAKGANAASATQLAMYRQNRADLAPYRDVGGQALNAYAQAMGLQGYGGGPGGDANSLTLLSGIRTKDKKGNRNVYVDNYTGNMYRLNDFGEYQQIGNIMAASGRNGKLEGVESNRNKGVYFVGGQLRSHGQNLGSFAIQDRPEAPVQGSAGTSDRYGGFYESPGYQWRYDEGQRGVDRNMAARGRYLSGAREKAAIRYGQNAASGEFGNYMNRLAGAAGIGQTAVNTGVSAGNTYATNAGNAQMGAANARASGYMGAANTLMSGVNNYAMYRALNRPPAGAGVNHQAPYDPTNPYV